MKHLVLFEAFNSDILGKTLRFIDKQSRATFKYWLIEIGRILDFPISEFSDDLFEYLPYNKALKKQPTDHKETIIPCDYESQWIPGEFCNEGRVKRTWGNHKRTVKCPKCDGKGTLSYQEEDNRVPRFIKFWFNKDGEFTLASGTNGYKSESFEFSRNKSDYKEVNKGLKAKDIKKLPTGSILWGENGVDIKTTFIPNNKTPIPIKNTISLLRLSFHLAPICEILSAEGRNRNFSIIAYWIIDFILNFILSNLFNLSLQTQITTVF